MPLLKISGGDISVTLSLPNCGSTTCVRLLMPLGKIFETLNGAQSPSLLLNTYKETFLDASEVRPNKLSQICFILIVYAISEKLI